MICHSVQTHYNGLAHVIAHSRAPAGSYEKIHSINLLIITNQFISQSISQQQQQQFIVIPIYRWYYLK